MGLMLNSGNLFRLYDKEPAVPTLEDIALGLSRQPRFAGQTPAPWTVLGHSHFCASIAIGIEQPTPESAELALAMLLHDAHEAMTGDTPTDLKTPAQRHVQADIDRVIYDAHFPGGYRRYLELREQVKEIDLRALRAEARVVGPVPVQEMDPETFAREFGSEPLPNDLDNLREGLSIGLDGPGGALIPVFGLEHPAARIWISSVEAYRSFVMTSGATPETNAEEEMLQAG